MLTPHESPQFLGLEGGGAGAPPKVLNPGRPGACQYFYFTTVGMVANDFVLQPPTKLNQTQNSKNKNQKLAKTSD